MDVPLAEDEAQLLRRREAKVARKQGRAALRRLDEAFPGMSAIFRIDPTSTIERGA
ncbi:hypothetical protein ACWD0G_34065 [Streptomyces goshikiensis]